jgi:two-component system sensor histidine kinase CpxA
LFDSRPWLACLAAIAAITVFCWIPLIRGLTRSVGQITAAAGQIAEGRFDVKTGVHRGDEIGQLNDAIHRMAAQLSGFVTGQRRFLGDIAHELCAPIARTRVALGVLEERAEPAQKQYVETAEEEMEHMSGLVNELLQFSKAGLSAKEPAAQPVLIADLIARVIEREAGQDGRVRLASGGSLRVLAQPEGLFRAVSNVVRNGLRYAGSHGPITISARRDGEHVLLSVADEGPGLPEDALDRVFTPFYRLDDSRSRESGGVGLGLAMVKSLVEASGGSVSCRNLSPSGLEVTMRLRVTPA